MHNPLVHIVPQLLAQFPDGCSEYQLMKAIDTLANGFPKLSDDDQLALFQKHFLVKNALYQLQINYWQQDNLYLSIEALHIELQRPDLKQLQSNTLPCDNRDHALREYYLDWQQFSEATQQSVSALLNDFWGRYINQQGRLDALIRLDLSTDATSREITTRYRQLASLHHPDKGGNPAEFIALREAYELLK